MKRRRCNNHDVIALLNACVVVGSLLSST